MVKTRKAQSAMEYLMTYGWAILIIAVVLGALFSLGVFNSSNLLGTSCVAYSGYECTSPLLHSGTFTATVGQATGTSWTMANALFVNYGVGSSGLTTASFAASSCVQALGALSSGQTASMSVTGYLSTAPSTCTSMSSTLGAAQAGSIWICYATSGSVCTYMAQIASVNVKAT